jgi:hypothetical protein
MNWEAFSLQFKQSFADGYRYLDKCGELILAAKKHDFMPGEITVMSGQLIIPEHLFTATVNAQELVTRQELPKDFGYFFGKSAILANLASEHFGLADIQANVFSVKWYWPARSPDDALGKSLKFKEKLQDELAKSLGMVPAAARTDFNFSSGNLDLHVVLQAIAFENVTLQQHNAPFGATRDQKTRIGRLRQPRPVFPQDLAHAVFLEIDLKELDPPVNSMEKHFGLLKAKSDILVKRLSLA